MHLLNERDGKRLVHEYETVFLEGIGPSNLVVGDHYGDPTGGIIDRRGEWVASCGEGVQVYRIGHPFTQYSRDPAESNQWAIWNPPQNSGRSQQVESIHQDSKDCLVVSVSGDKPYVVIFQVRTTTRSIDLVAEGQYAIKEG